MVRDATWTLTFQNQSYFQSKDTRGFAITKAGATKWNLNFYHPDAGVGSSAPRELQKTFARVELHLSKEAAAERFKAIPNQTLRGRKT